ncbi:MAG: alanine racemase [Bacillota bacterium]
MMEELSKLRPAWAEINLDYLADNIRQIRDHLAADTELMTVLKADGYGHGAYQVAQVALANGTDRLAVAILDEALALRQAGLTDVPILILGWTPPDLAVEVVKHDLTQTIYSYQAAKSLSQAAVRLDQKAKVHLKVDTGMGRIGLQPDEVLDLMRRIDELSNLEVEGIYTHFAAADEGDKEYTYHQLEQFQQVITNLRAAGFEVPLTHAANSAAALDLPTTELDMVRVGILTYGLLPSQSVEQSLDLTPVLSLKARVCHVKEVPPGTDISYGRTYTTASRAKIATLPLGYEDGYSRLLSSQGEVLIKGQRVPIVGRVCMDQLMIDVSKIESVEVGEVVTLLGRDDLEEINARELADQIGTINYEVVCMISKRIPRVYLQNNQVVEIAGTCC